MKERTEGQSYGGFSQGFGDFWQQAGWQQQTSGYEEETRLRAAGNYLRNGYYREARNTLDGMGEHEKTARWYYYSAMAHMGLGNNVAALEHAGKAVALEPQNMEYQMLLQRLQSGGQWYESRQAAYGYPNASGNDLCLKSVWRTCSAICAAVVAVCASEGMVEEECFKKGTCFFRISSL